MGLSRPDGEAAPNVRAPGSAAADGVGTLERHAARPKALRLQMLALSDETGNRFWHYAYRDGDGGSWKLPAGRF